MTSPAVEEISGLSRFQSLWQRCLIKGAADASTEIHQRLVDGYNEPQRRYHTLAHIEHCLSMFEQCKSLTASPDALEIAIWFHDVIFQPGNPDNEALSAELYEELSAGAHTDEFRALVSKMIMATLHNECLSGDSDIGYMVDIDLSSFGLAWEDFLRDSSNLREESRHLSEAAYSRKQGEFRANLLARPRFYQTEFFFQRYEQQARDNLTRYFDQLDEPTRTG